jgi:hypothetical protein
VIGIPILSSSWASLFVDIETATNAVEGKGGHIAEPGQPGCFICWPKTLLKLSLSRELIEAVIS